MKLMKAIHEGISAALVKAKEMPNGHWAQVYRKIPTLCDDRAYPITSDGLVAAQQLTKQVWDSRKEFQQTISWCAFSELSFKAIGTAISKTPKECPDGVEFHKRLGSAYRKILNDLVAGKRGDADWHKPCQLFQNTEANVPSFNVGPVMFRPRSEWIKYFVQDPGTRSVIDQVERGELQVDELRRLALEELSNQAACYLEPDQPTGPKTRGSASGSGYHNQNAQTVFGCLQGYCWVGTIRVTNHDWRQASRKASVLVALAIDAIGLRFSADEARRLAMAGRAQLFRDHHLATSVNDSHLMSEHTLDLPGLHPVRAEETHDDQGREFLDRAGSILQAYMEGRQTHKAHDLVEAWANALHWTGEARREPSDFMAVVKYGCAIDIVSGTSPKREFTQAAFNSNRVPKLNDDASKVRKMVEDVYKQGRSKLVHGGVPGLLEDYLELRKKADSLLKGLFAVVTPTIEEILADRTLRVDSDRKWDRKEAFCYLKKKLSTEPVCDKRQFSGRGPARSEIER